MITEALTSPDITVPHGFFTRRGGVSQGPFASLNCSLSGADERAAVLENRGRIAHSLGVSAENLVGLSQVHSADVVVVEIPWAVGWGPRADAMVTSLRGVALGVITADCAPVLFADRRAGVIGAAHAGWRGAADGVLEATIEAMRKLGATDIAAVVGPWIRQPSSEVAADMRDAVLAADPSGGPFFADGANPDRWQFDLAGYCVARLRAGGAAWTSIIDADTLPDADRFFSHRRRTLAGGGSIGHQMSAIAL